MHIPDGFINGTTSLGAGVIAAGGLGVSLRVSGRYLQDRQIPLAGLLAAFIFVMQMINFPVAAGTSGHLLGGALAVILVGPWLGATVMSVVVIVQALLFADGGVSALGLNILNMALVTVAVGWIAFRLVKAVLPARRWAITSATFAAAFFSVLAASAGFVIQYSLGGAGSASIRTVLTAMTGVHALIGIGEGLITAAVVGSVLAVRPDLVHGAMGLDSKPRRPRRRIGGFVVAGVAVTVALAWFVAPLASNSPDGLERVAIEQGFDGAATETPLAESPVAGYSVPGLGNVTGTRIAGAVGIVAMAALGTAAALWTRRRTPTPA